jgi:hypothetical protein
MDFVLKDPSATRRIPMDSIFYIIGVVVVVLFIVAFVRRRV